MALATTQDSLGRSVVFSKHNTSNTTSLPTIEARALCRPDTCSGANDAELRDRSAPDVCSIATLRGPLL